MKSISALVLITIFGAISLGGCARDRDLNDLNKDKLKEDLAKLEAVTGTFSGQLISNKTGQSLGAVGVTLEADTKNNSFNDQTAVLKGTVFFQGATVVKIVFQNSYFDAETNSFKTTLSNPPSGGGGGNANGGSNSAGSASGGSNSAGSASSTSGAADIALELKGQVDGNTLNASIESFGYSELGGQMKLERAVSTQSFEQIFSQPLPAGQISIESFSRLYQGKMGGKTIQVSLDNTQLNPPLSAEDRFTDALSPSRRLSASLILSTDNIINFNTARWYNRSKTLSAISERTSTFDKFVLALQCTATTPDERELNCIYTSTLTDLRREFKLSQISR